MKRIPRSAGTAGTPASVRSIAERRRIRRAMRPNASGVRLAVSERERQDAGGLLGRTLRVKEFGTGEASSGFGSEGAFGPVESLLDAPRIEGPSVTDDHDLPPLEGYSPTIGERAGEDVPRQLLTLSNPGAQLGIGVNADADLTWVGAMKPNSPLGTTEAEQTRLDAQRAVPLRSLTGDFMTGNSRSNRSAFTMTESSERSVPFMLSQLRRLAGAGEETPQPLQTVAPFLNTKPDRLGMQLLRGKRDELGEAGAVKGERQADDRIQFMQTMLDNQDRMRLDVAIRLTRMLEDARLRKRQGRLGKRRDVPMDWLWLLGLVASALLEGGEDGKDTKKDAKKRPVKRQVGKYEKNEKNEKNGKNETMTGTKPAGGSDHADT